MYKTAATKIRTVVAFVSTSIITFTARRITTPKSVFPIVLLNTLKYSLQGTTQGRYLTGGVPPVRFSM